MMRSGVLWTLAVLVTVAAAGWQRRSGPSYPYRARVTLGDTSVSVSLIRSHLSSAGARVRIPAPDGARGNLVWRRFPTEELFTILPMWREGDELLAELPAQPAAGKVEYFIQVTVDSATVRVPERTAAVLRYRGSVPAYILIPHIALMFLGLLVGTRAGLGAASGEGERRGLAWFTLAAFTVGGLVLGAITQRYAFGEYWTGVPFGWDLTDNKTLVMWIGWLAAGIALARRRPLARALVVGAAVLTLAAYLVPHSAMGSQLDYSTEAPATSP